MSGELSTGPGRGRRRLPGLEWVLLLVAVADWFALRRGVAPHPPALLAILVAAVGVTFVARLAETAWRWRRERRRWVGHVAEIVLLAGALAALSSGMANWLFRLQGFTILHEGRPVPLHGGTHLQGFRAGPMARLEEMDLVLTLEELELVPRGGGAFYPRSRLALEAGDDVLRLTVDPQNSGRASGLRYFQGAFGFAPRILVRHDGRVLFDEVFPFLTRLHGEDAISFEGSFRIEEEDLDVEGAVDLETLDEAMRGHVKLALTLRQDERVLGQGTLRMGHFATLDEGYEIGFTGLERWSEIDVFHRSYGRGVLAGAAAALAAALVWLFAVWRRW